MEPAKRDTESTRDPGSAKSMVNGNGADSVPELTLSPASKLSKDEVNRIRAENIHPSINAFTMFKDDPVHLAKGEMQYVYDVDGKKYLDGFGGICTVGVGHCHPHVNAALHKQVDELWHNSALYVHDKMHEYAQKLIKKLGQPDRLNRVYFVNSGSEANDLAMQMARVATGNDLCVALRNGYHGMGSGAAQLTSHNTWRHANSAGVLHVMNPDPLHGVFGGYRNGEIVRKDKPELPHAEAHKLYAKQMEEAIQYGTNGKIAAFFGEPIQGVGGTVQLCDGFLKEAYKVARAHGGVCICDEVQTGFGRLGSGAAFWGFDFAGVDPDIVVMAKSIGNGFPLAAVVTTEAVAAPWAKKLHFNTYGGNPMASTVGIAVLEAIEKDNLHENCEVIGNRLINGFKAMQEKYVFKTNGAPVIGDVRGRGLMLGVELWKEDGSFASAEVMSIVEGMKKRGVLMGKGGLNGQAIRIKPPMCWNEVDADFCLDVFEESLQETFAGSI